MTQADGELLDLVAEGRHALAAPAIERVSTALAVLPKLVDALDRVCAYQTELRDVRAELTIAVRTFREAVWNAQKMHPDVTYNGGEVHAALTKVSSLLGRLDRLLHSEEA